MHLNIRDPQEEQARIEYGESLVLYIDSFRPDAIIDVYGDICNALHEIPFVCLVKLDENRVSDALRMRSYIIPNSADHAYYKTHFPQPSVLEVLCAFARLCWESDGCNEQYYPSDWLRMFFSNMELTDEYGNTVSSSPGYIRDRASIMMERRYAPNGEHGGLFHISDESIDLTRLQLFEQMDIYLGALETE